MFKEILVVLFLTVIAFGRGTRHYESGDSSGSCSKMDVFTKNETEENATDLRSSFYERQNQKIEEIHGTATFLNAMLGVVILCYLYVARKVRKIIPETRLWADEIVRGSFGPEEIKDLSLKAHIKHLCSLKQYVLIEILSIYFIYFFITETMSLQSQSVELTQYVEDALKNFTVPLHPDNMYLQKQLSCFPSFFTALYLFYGVFLLVNFYYVSRIAICTFIYFKEKFFAMPPSLIVAKIGENNNNGDNVVSIEETIILEYFEYVMIELVAKHGDERLIQHVGQNIFANRLRNLDEEA